MRKRRHMKFIAGDQVVIEHGPGKGTIGMVWETDIPSSSLFPRFMVLFRGAKDINKEVNDVHVACLRSIQ